MNLLCAIVYAIVILFPGNHMIDAACTLTEQAYINYYTYTDFEGMVKSDIRNGQEGVTLKLQLAVVDRSCNPVMGARVDLWQVNATGFYSVEFLRGAQFTDNSGIVSFTTIIPGIENRVGIENEPAHIHFNVWRDNEYVLTSILIIPESAIEIVYEMSPVYTHPPGKTLSMPEYISVTGLRKPSERFLQLKLLNNIFDESVIFYSEAVVVIP